MSPNIGRVLFEHPNPVSQTKPKTPLKNCPCEKQKMRANTYLYIKPTTATCMRKQPSTTTQPRGTSDASYTTPVTGSRYMSVVVATPLALIAVAFAAASSVSTRDARENRRVHKSMMSSHLFTIFLSFGGFEAFPIFFARCEGVAASVAYPYQIFVPLAYPRQYLHSGKAHPNTQTHTQSKARKNAVVAFDVPQRLEFVPHTPLFFNLSPFVSFYYSLVKIAHAFFVCVCVGTFFFFACLFVTINFRVFQFRVNGLPPLQTQQQCKQ